MFASRSLRLSIIAMRRNVHAYSSSVKKENTIRIDQWDINYIKVGHGPHHVLCLPGTLGTIWTDFKSQIEEFDKNKFTLVVWDPPGYGKSRPPLRKFMTDLYERDAAHAYELMKALHIRKYSILGWSGGGVSGVIHAGKYPEVMEKLVVWGCPPFVLPHELEWYKKIRDIDEWSEQMKVAFLEIYGKELLATYWSEWVDTMTAIYNEKSGNLCAHILKRIKCPTFVLQGDRDTIVEPSHARYLIKNIRGARLHTYTEGKHNIHLKYGNDFNTRVQDFLQNPTP